MLYANHTSIKKKQIKRKKNIPGKSPNKQNTAMSSSNKKKLQVGLNLISRVATLCYLKCPDFN